MGRTLYVLGAYPDVGATGNAEILFYRPGTVENNSKIWPSFLYPLSWQKRELPPLTNLMRIILHHFMYTMRRKQYMRLLLTSLSMLAFFNNSNAQRGIVTDLETLIKNNQFKEAQQILTTRIPQLFTLSNRDTLIAYPKYIGKVAAKLTDDANAIKQVQAYASRVTASKPPAKTLLRVYMECAGFYSLKGQNNLSYKTIEQAAHIIGPALKDSVSEDALVQSELGVYAYRMGNPGLSGHHHRTATHLLETIKVNPNYERLYTSYNNVGTVMWFGSKIDSGIYFFDKALAALSKLDQTPENKFYRVATVQNNLAQLYNEQGNSAKAIATMEANILNLKTFLATKEPNPKKDVAIIRQFESIENLARIYRHLGDFSKAQQLLLYSYQQKQKAFGDQSPEIYKAMISLGSLYFEQHDFKTALTFLNDGLNRVYTQPVPSPLWAGEATNALARLYEMLGDKSRAAYFYQQTDSLYEMSFGGEYDESYFDFIRSEALFFASNHQPALAVAKARKGYDYIVKTQSAETLSAFRQLLNLSQVYYELGDYNQSLVYSQQSLQVANKRITAATVLLDSIKAEISKPDAILLKAKAEYALSTTNDSTKLKSLVSDLNEALAIIDRKRTIIKDANDITILMSQHKELLDFIKELKMKLYALTRNEVLIDEVIDLHESAIYNRIRSRLDKQKAIRFAELPDEVQIREQELQLALSTSLKESNISVYLQAVKNWNGFQDELKMKYPKYYQMRYASQQHQSIAGMQQHIPSDVTVVRYVYTGKDLFALVATQKENHWIALNANETEQWIATLANVGEVKQTTTLSYQLYQRLWQPLQQYIQTKRVVVIPDGPLYYVSFDMLSSKQTSSYKDLIANSLLQKYAIGYHYSMLALSPTHDEVDSRSNFTAFVPAFNDKVKNDYRSAIKTDTLKMDNEYLSLLPLPFSVSLANNTQKQMGGHVYEGESSTPAAFKQHAGNNAIIHIGTHAEANNQYPEYSRLIFAKDPSRVNDSNSVFLYDIYNYDLASDLAVLTACETGKPGFFDGEGMISMAHAFNYAGSESILTGLWKIDEQVSSEITALFYKNLQEGMTKDVALQQAKISYLNSANDRVLAPNYWAGLVIMGDTSPVQLENTSKGWAWWLGGGVLLIAGLIGVMRLRGRVAKK